MQNEDLKLSLITIITLGEKKTNGFIQEKEINMQKWKPLNFAKGNVNMRETWSECFIY